MHVFWAKGYEASSLEDLCNATGLGRSSLYAAFSDKRRLYIEVLNHYQNPRKAPPLNEGLKPFPDRAIARIGKALDGSAPIREQLDEFLTSTINSIISG